MAAKHIGLIANLDKTGAVDLLRRLYRELSDAGHTVRCHRAAAEAADLSEGEHLDLPDLRSTKYPQLQSDSIDRASGHS